MIQSDPVTQYGVAGQYGEWYTWMNDSFIAPSSPRFAPCGRLRQAPTYYKLSLNWSDPTYIPPSTLADQISLFQSQILIRDQIRWQVPPTPLWSVPTVNCPFPQFVYTCAHWMSPGSFSSTLSGQPAPLGTYFDMKWYLFYGTAADLVEASFDAPVDQTALLGDFYDYDSSWTDSDPTDINTNAIQGQGWCLCLIHREIDSPTGSNSQTYYQFTSPLSGTIVMPVMSNPVTVAQRIYFAYELTPLPPGPPGSPTVLPVFDALGVSSWTPFHNALGLPAHTVSLSPYQP